MTAAPVQFPPESAAAIRRHAEGGRPEEVCGFLLGAASPQGVRVERTIPATNAWEPAAERTRRYAFDPREQVVAERTARDAGLDVVGYYHSHPTSPPVPSGVDLDLAWPAYTYIIVGFVGNTSVLRAWTLDKAGGGFVEQQILPAGQGGTGTEESDHGDEAAGPGF